MLYITEKNKVPVLWLDTHAVTQIAEALFNHKPETEHLRKLYELIVDLRINGKIFSFEANQLDEIEVRTELVKKGDGCSYIHNENVRTHYQQPQRMQFQIAVKAFANNARESEIPWRTAFMDNPNNNQATSGFFIRVRTPRNAEEIAERRRINREIAKDWEELRKKLSAQKKPQKIRREQQTEKELLAMQDYARKMVDDLAMKQLRGEQLSNNEFWRALDIIGLPLSLFVLHLLVVDIQSLFEKPTRSWSSLLNFLLDVDKNESTCGLSMYVVSW